MQEVIMAPVKLSDSAAQELLRLKETDNIEEEKYLRVGVKGGGCSGMSYILEYDEKQTFDEVYEVKGVKLIVDKRHSLYVYGMEVDFQSGLNDRGFIFINPNAKTTCGCGTSFST